MKEYDQEITDVEDYTTLLLLILNQAVQDYIRHQHPSRRNKKEYQKAFNTAVDMILDDEYRLSHFQNEDGIDMSVIELIRTILPSRQYKIENLREMAAAESVKYWNEQKLNTLFIPDHLVVDGHVYRIFEGPLNIDFKEQIIYMPELKNTSQNQETFLGLVVDILVHHSGALTPSDLKSILFRTLRMNNCFCGDF